MNGGLRTSFNPLQIRRQDITWWYSDLIYVMKFNNKLYIIFSFGEEMADPVI